MGRMGGMQIWQILKTQSEADTCEREAGGLDYPRVVV